MLPHLFLTYLLKAFFIVGLVINVNILLDNEDKLLIANKVLTNINNNHIISDVDMVDKIVKIIKEYVNAN